MTTATIQLGGKNYEIRPLTIGQILGLSENPAGATTTSQIVNFLAVALKRDHPEMTREALLETESTIPELQAAFEKIQAISNLEPAKEAGESGAGPTTLLPAGAG